MFAVTEDCAAAGGMVALAVYWLLPTWERETLAALLVWLPRLLPGGQAQSVPLWSKPKRR